MGTRIPIRQLVKLRLGPHEPWPGLIDHPLTHRPDVVPQGTVTSQSLSHEQCRPKRQPGTLASAGSDGLAGAGGRTDYMEGPVCLGMM